MAASDGHSISPILNPTNTSSSTVGIKKTVQKVRCQPLEKLQSNVLLEILIPLLYSVVLLIFINQVRLSSAAYLFNFSQTLLTWDIFPRIIDALGNNYSLKKSVGKSSIFIN
jgi:hypothetical protein